MVSETYNKDVILHYNKINIMINNVCINYVENEVVRLLHFHSNLHVRRKG